ncbi:MAG: DivIVA domain-containing protein [Ferruginibacter sp.]|nr:DivIVA domain-containing protein [Cytophagales bacterium]
MKITPIEIRQKTFEKVFRGYEKEEVSAFLLSLSQEWERLTDENKEYKFKLEMAEREVKKLKEVENSLYRTLKTAEDTGTHLIEQATKSADLRLMESQQKAEMMLADAQNRAKILVMEADKQAKQAMEEMLAELKSLERDFRAMENMRDNMMMELKSMANDTLERVNRLDAKNAHVSFGSKIREVKDLIDRKASNPYEEDRLYVSSREEPPRQLPEETGPARPETAKATNGKQEPAGEAPAKPVPSPVAYQPAAVEQKRAGSFFDELEEN